ncbi:MAG: hypothetical protein ACK42G_04210 [Candidatus Kapaibacteriota bacterium]
MKKYLKLIIGGVVGGIIGYFYYYFIGCRGGSCPITSNPYVSTLWGMLLGIIIFYPSKNKIKDDNQRNNN